MATHSNNYVASPWKTRLEKITPMRAQELLLENHGNRVIRWSRVMQYAAAMREGRWSTTPEPLMIGVSGRLLNGQHRLHAIIKSGIPVVFSVAVGVPDDVYAHLDRGGIRSMADALQKPRKLIEVCNTILQIGGYQETQDPIVTKCFNIFELTLRELLDGKNGGRKLYSATIMRAATVLRMYTGDADQKHYAYQTYRDLVTGHISALPPVAQNFVGYMSNNSVNVAGRSGRLTVAPLIWQVLDYKNRLKKNVSYKGQHVDAALEDMRATVRKSMGD